MIRWLWLFRRDSRRNAASTVPEPTLAVNEFSAKEKQINDSKITKSKEKLPKPKSYADIAKTKNEKTKNKEVTQKQRAKKKIAQAVTKMEPPSPVQLYQMNEFENCFTKITEILDKIKIELKIESFFDLANYLEEFYKILVAQQDVMRKTLVFMDGISKIPAIL